MGTPNQISAAQMISAIDQLILPKLEQLFDRLLALQAERKASHLSASEPGLMRTVNQTLPSDLRARIAELRERRDEGSITDVEVELATLIDRGQELPADRLTALAELAKLRGEPLPSLMSQLAIQYNKSQLFCEIESARLY